MNITAGTNIIIINLPIRGLSEVMGMIDETVFRNIVRDNSMVTPNNNNNNNNNK